MTDLQAIAAEVVTSVREFVTRAVEPIVKRLDDFEKRLTQDKSATDIIHSALAGVQEDYAPSKYVGELADQIDALGKRFLELPAPKDGIPGVPGKDGAAGEKGADAVVDYDKIGEIISLAVAKAVASMPVPKDGVDGKDGAAGEKGERGESVVGERGERGEKGELGDSVKGESGRDGIDGKDGPQSLLINESGELVAVYPDGETKTIGVARGKDGIRGASVMDGAVDDSGQLVLRMSDGRIINAGIVRGERGKDGSDGKGIPGRDANELRVLPAIDEAKSYPEGTSALYRGGEIRAERTTDPIVDGDILKAGWRVAREGIAEETETDSDDGRIIERTTIYTSGRTFTRRITTRAMVYRGINKTDVQYERGDVTTFDGQLWHCNESTSDRPGISHAWQLCTRKGRDGKPGDSVKGDPGQPGKPGRDLTQMGPNGTKY